MITHQYFPLGEVRASHMMKKSTNGDTMHFFDLPSNVDDPRNGLLLLEPIKQAFDRKDICFLYNPLTNNLIAKVLNPELMDQHLSTSRTRYTMTFRYINGRILKLPPGIFPYRRILSFHAKFAYSRVW